MKKKSVVEKPTISTISKIGLASLVLVAGVAGSAGSAVAGSSPLSKERIYTVTDNDRLGTLGPGGRAAFALRCSDENDVALSVSCDVEGEGPSATFPKVSITRQALYNQEDGQSVGICAWHTPPDAGEAYDLWMSMECLTINGKK